MEYLLFLVIRDLPDLHDTANVRESSLAVALPISLSILGCSRYDPMDLYGLSSVKQFLT